MNTLKRTIFLLMSIAVPFMVTAQNVTFYSSEFAEGVKIHLGLDANSVVTQQQTDTITAINLSGLGINDIRDVVYLPNVHTLNLSYNDIRDVAPLLPLDSLHYVDLRGNQLQDINVLSFSCSDSLVLSVAYNYITDFSRILMPSSCHISISGMSAQKDKHPSYMDVYQFYADIQEGQPVINYRGYSSMGSGIILECGNTQVVAEMTGNFNTVSITDNLSSTTMATLSNGVKDYTTWVVPSKHFESHPGETLTLPTGLPDSYTINFVNAVHGTAAINGTDLVYTAPDVVVNDTLSFSYYENGVLKGFSQYHFGKTANFLLGDANGDGDVSLIDILLTVDYYLGKNPAGFIFDNVEMDGDNEISLADILAIVDIILNQNSASIPATARESKLDVLALTANGSNCTLHLDNSEPCRGISFTITLPEGGTMGSLTIPTSRADGHSALFKAVAPGHYNVVVYGNSGKPLRDGTTAMLNFDISGCQASDITISDIQMVNAWNETILLPATHGITTGIARVNDGDSDDGELWYNTVGVGSNKPTRGVNIHNGKKTGQK